MKAIKALTFGEILFDIINGSAHLGGAPLNLAVHLAKIGETREGKQGEKQGGKSEAKPAVISAVGKDELGDKLLNEAEKLGIDTSYISIDEKKPTGTVTVELKDEGIPHFTIHENVAWDAITIDAEKTDALAAEEWDVFCIGTLAQRSEANRKTLQRLLPVIRAKNLFYDVNLRPGFYEKEWIETSLAFADIVKMNSEEASIISGMLFNKTHDEEELCRLLVEKYPNISIICITKGAGGAAIYHNENNRCAYEEVKTISIEVADTVGAGDAFSAGFLYAYFSGCSVSEAASFACALGTYVASKPGSVPEYSDEILEKLEGIDR
ncbi:carbohydrate kinase family protein [Methanosarcina sp. Mfa9]|uniref:carbohydrate kinase family protein n=1 Tax=Methanosarcina sp. Mfa9 TaxID=3439063 RepID=UPI003F840BEC